MKVCRSCRHGLHICDMLDNNVRVWHSWSAWRIVEASMTLRRRCKCKGCDGPRPSFRRSAGSRRRLFRSGSVHLPSSLTTLSATPPIMACTRSDTTSILSTFSGCILRPMCRRACTMTRTNRVPAQYHLCIRPRLASRRSCHHQPLRLGPLLPLRRCHETWCQNSTDSRCQFSIRR